jgi:hypothetical protein
LKGIIMKTNFTTIAIVLASTLVASTSFAVVTRKQVQAEYAQAVRTGDVIADGEVSLKLNELYPNRYPAKQVQPGHYQVHRDRPWGDDFGLILKSANDFHDPAAAPVANGPLGKAISDWSEN